VSDPNGTHPQRSAEERRQTPAPSTARQLIELVLTIAVAFLLAQAVRTWVVQPYVVPTGSMLPTIQLHDQVLANKFTYFFNQPEAGQIVVFDNPILGHSAEEDTLIKRVIAVGGQTVDLRGGKVVVDGKALTEPYTYGQPSDPLDGSAVTFPLTIPREEIWVMGDNRTQSEDSRWFGPVPVSSVHGQAFFIYWPLSRLGSLK
jgi:signal peptidase I